MINLQTKTLKKTTIVTALKGTIHAAGNKRVDAALLIGAIVREHRDIGVLVDQIENTKDNLDAALNAWTLQTMFNNHLEREELDLLPLLVQDPEVDLAVLLHGMHKLISR